MSEIAKCPVCGNRLTDEIDGIIVCWSGCSFRCGGYALPRIAAAMELARELTALSKSDLNNECREIEKRVEKAERRVLEVFGGE